MSLYVTCMIKKLCRTQKKFKTSITLWVILKKKHRVIKFNQKVWPKSYIDMNTKLRTEAKNDFEKDFFKLLNNAFFRKTLGNVRIHRDIKLATTNKRRYYLVSEPNYHTTKCFSENALAIEMKN